MDTLQFSNSSECFILYTTLTWYQNHAVECQPNFRKNKSEYSVVIHQHATVLPKKCVTWRDLRGGKLSQRSTKRLVSSNNLITECRYESFVVVFSHQSYFYNLMNFMPSEKVSINSKSMLSSQKSPSRSTRKRWDWDDKRLIKRRIMREVKSMPALPHFHSLSFS